MVRVGEAEVAGEKPSASYKHVHHFRALYLHSIELRHAVAEYHGRVHEMQAFLCLRARRSAAARLPYDCEASVAIIA